MSQDLEEQSWTEPGGKGSRALPSIESDVIKFDPNLLSDEHEALFEAAGVYDLPDFEFLPNSSRHGRVFSEEDPVTIKQEEIESQLRRLPYNGETIVLSDSEDDVVHIKNEPTEDQPKFDWSGMPKHIDLSGDEEIDIKREESESSFDWTAMGPDTIDLVSDDELDQPLGQSFLQKTSNKRKRPAVPLELMQKMQDKLKERIRQKHGHSGGASNIFRKPSGFSTNVHIPSAEVQSEEIREDFQDIKKRYLAKKKGRSNTMQDDIAFKKAQDAQLRKIRRLERELDNDSGNESDGLFVSNTPTEPDAEREQDQDQEPDEDKLKNTAAGSKGRKRKPARVGKLSKAEIEKQLSLNMQAGMPERLQNKLSQLAVERNEAQKNKTHSKRIQALLNRFKSGPKKGGKMTGLANISSLTNNNFFEAQTQINQKGNLPIMSGRVKAKAIRDLVASIPLEEEQRAKADADGAAIHKATVIVGHCKVEENPQPGEGGWRVKGMVCTLHHYQIMGVAKMKERELDAIIPGGILADDMGLGKTIQSMALMLSNPPTPEEEHRATLIVCSPALMHQWDVELSVKKEAQVLPRILRHYANSRMPSKGASGRASIGWMEKADVVLTTYSEVMKSYPKYEISDEGTDAEEKREIWKDIWEKKRGLLHRVHWRRIIVDEASVMKNYASSTSISCRALMGKHRWALSGTPIMNSLKEFYPYFKFLQIPQTGTSKTFQQNFCGDGTNLYVGRLHAFLDHIMIRRVYTDVLLNSKLVTLPEYFTNIQERDLNVAETCIYQILNARFAKAINHAAKNGEQAKKDMIIRKILRLRQITSHIMMLQEYMERVFDVEDIEDLLTELEEPLRHCQGLPQDSSRQMLEAIKAMIKAKDQDDEAKVSDSHIKIKTLVEDFRALLRDLKKNRKWTELQNVLVCQFCRQSPSMPMVTTCMHLYCRQCLITMGNQVSANLGDRTKCLKCDKVYEKCEELPNIELLQARYNPELNSWGIEGVSNRPSRSAIQNLKWCSLDSEVLHSTKSAAVVQQIEDWLKDFPRQKIVVFSQFHLFIKVIERACSQKGWKYCSYHGEMSQLARQNSIEQFKDDTEISVMVASLMAGGVGLNLTMAQRVIIVDLWWNEAMERQAFGRVYRIGQTQETHLVRMVVRDSVDQKMLKTQQRKSEEISKAMENREMLLNMTVEDLMGLFGEVGRDENDHPFIYVQEHSFLKKLPPKITTPNEAD